MREIKFRAWDKEKGMTYQDNLRWIALSGDGNWTMNTGHGSKIQLITGCGFPENHLMQFTGLKDKNGKEIWEGDVVSASIYADEIPQVLEVRWEAGCFVIDYKDSEADFCAVGWFPGTLEAIGDIYSNPELLKD